MVRYRVLGNRNILHSTGSTRGFSKINRQAFPQDIVFALFYLINITSVLFVVPHRNCLTEFLVFFNMPEVMITSKYGSCSGFQQLLKDLLLIFQRSCHSLFYPSVYIIGKGFCQYRFNIHIISNRNRQTYTNYTNTQRLIRQFSVLLAIIQFKIDGI